MEFSPSISRREVGGPPYVFLTEVRGRPRNMARRLVSLAVLLFCVVVELAHYGNALKEQAAGEAIESVEQFIAGTSREGEANLKTPKVVFVEGTQDYGMYVPAEKSGLPVDPACKCMEGKKCTIQD